MTGLVSRVTCSTAGTPACYEHLPPLDGSNAPLLNLKTSWGVLETYPAGAGRWRNRCSGGRGTQLLHGPIVLALSSEKVNEPVGLVYEQPPTGMQTMNSVKQEKPMKSKKEKRFQSSESQTDNERRNYRDLKFCEIHMKCSSYRPNADHMPHPCAILNCLTSDLH